MTRDEIIKLASQAIDDTRSAVSLPIPFVMQFARAIETAVLRSNGFDIQPTTEAGG